MSPPDDARDVAIRAVVVRDDTLLRAAIARLLEGEGVSVIAHAASVDDLPDGLNPDVVVADLARSDLTVLREHLPGARILLTGANDGDAVSRAMAAGAVGLISTDANVDEFIDAVHRAARGERYVDPSLVADLATRRAVVARADETITRRERDVLRLIAEGFTNAEIADELEIGLRTVEAHRSKLMHKLGFKRRADAVRYWRDVGSST